MGSRLFGARNIIAELAVQGGLGWRKLEERREEMKVLFEREPTVEDGGGETKS